MPQDYWEEGLHGKKKKPDIYHTLNRNHYNCCNFSHQEILCILIHLKFYLLLKE